MQAARRTLESLIFRSQYRIGGSWMQRPIFADAVDFAFFCEVINEANPRREVRGA